MVSDFPESDGCVPVHHTSSCVIFHDLVFHKSQFLRHFHRLLLMMQHILAQLVNDKFAALNVFFRPV